jgi:SAM-dependent methyltransferase
MVRIMDPTQRFGERAQDYARARPGYPGAVVQDLARALCLPSGALVVDLGCGTGLSALPFLESGFRVVGVEPNEAMRGQLAGLAASWPQLRVAAGRAEATGLADASADLVVAAQAFHWFDVPAARSEALRILRRPARAALIWNDRRAEGTPFAEAYEQLLLRYSPDYLEIRHRHAREDRVARFFGHEAWSTFTARHEDQLDYARLARRLSSASYVPAPGDPRHRAMMDELQALFAAASRDGNVRMEFETRVLYGEIDPAERV